MLDLQDLDKTCHAKAIFCKFFFGENFQHRKGSTFIEWRCQKAPTKIAEIENTILCSMLMLEGPDKNCRGRGDNTWLNDDVRRS